MYHRDLQVFSALLGVVVFSFIAGASYVVHGASGIEEAAEDIAENTAPGIHLLTSARSEVRSLQRSVENNLASAESGCTLAIGELRDSQNRIHGDVQLYENLPSFAAERSSWEQTREALRRLDDIIARLVSLSYQHQCAEAHSIVQGEFRYAAGRTVERFMSNIEQNATRSHAQAQKIRHLRARLARSALILNALCILLAVAAALTFGHNLRRQSALREAEHRLAIERAAELEQFAGRVAHDILNPLQVVSYAIRDMDRMPDDSAKAKLLARGRSSVQRIQVLLDGLLRFACAGAHPEPGVHADVTQVMAELEAELRVQAADAAIELTVEHCAPGSVACSPGILTSLVGNLAQNAIKYLGDAVERRITLRVLQRATFMRFEVEDTGPGVAPDLQQAIFHPHVRARGSVQPGFGLGLATVKKAVEAHGGHVGIRSAPGRGSLFWFELPFVQAEASKR